MTSHTFDDVTAITVMFFKLKSLFPRQFTGLFQGFWGKSPLPKLGIFMQYTLVFSPVTQSIE
jgi:hypothetical protein